MRKDAVFAGVVLGAVPIAFLLIAFLLNAFFPLNHPGLKGKDSGFSVVVVSGNLSPMRGFPDKNGVWRYPVSLKDVSGLYIEALLNYEDRWFYTHPGVNPLSLLRAAYQYVTGTAVVTGGSTITMQVARIFHPHRKTIFGKVKQILRALQLECYLSKDQILTLYLNYAPFGGPLEGVLTASYAYLGKSASELTHAEAALLAVLPQAPSRMRPDRHPDRAEKARNKVLDRLALFGVWDANVVRDAKMERVSPRIFSHPMKAPLLARRLRKKASPLSRLKTGIDDHIQESITRIIADHTFTAPSRRSAAALVVDNRTLLVNGYCGSADFFNADRFGHVDMVHAIRSPGSTLKPFLYGFAMEEGLIHSESLLVDAPTLFKGYGPVNFNSSFSGPVGVTEALQRSLNVSAVDILDRLGSDYFYTRLLQGGFSLKLPSGASPNLSLILGGAGARLEDLVSAYTAFARGGMAGKLRFAADDPLREYPMMSPGAAWIIRKILEDHSRSDLPGGGRLNLLRSRKIAWKTGTSYGFRDAWAIGVTDSFTVGVWTGRPDGTSSPGFYGAVSAAPLLFKIVDSLPQRPGRKAMMPESVSQEEICWPLGTIATGIDSLCHEKRKAWILNGMIPPTFPDRNAPAWQINPVEIKTNPLNGLRVDRGWQGKACSKKIALWPRSSYPWLSNRIRKLSAIPDYDPSCKNHPFNGFEGLKIMGVSRDTVYRSPGNSRKLPEITLVAQGGMGRLYWLLNDCLIAETGVGEVSTHRFERAGRFRLVVMDQAGSYDEVGITVQAGGD